MSIRGQPNRSSRPMGPTPHSSPLTAPLRKASLVVGPGAGCHPRPQEKGPGPCPSRPGARKLPPGLSRPPPYAPCILADSNCALPLSLTTTAVTRSRCTALLSSASPPSEASSLRVLSGAPDDMGNKKQNKEISVRCCGLLGPGVAAWGTKVPVGSRPWVKPGQKLDLSPPLPQPPKKSGALHKLLPQVGNCGPKIPNPGHEDRPSCPRL